MKPSYMLLMLFVSVMLSGCATKQNAGVSNRTSSIYTASDVLEIVSSKLENERPNLYSKCEYVSAPDNNISENGTAQKGVCFFDKNSLVFVPIAVAPLPKSPSAYEYYLTPYKSIKEVGVSKNLSPNTPYDCVQLQIITKEGSSVGVSFLGDAKPGYDIDVPASAARFLWQKRISKSAPQDMWVAPSEPIDDSMPTKKDDPPMLFIPIFLPNGHMIML